LCTQCTAGPVPAVTETIEGEAAAIGPVLLIPALIGSLPVD
jgi:hypothetical protein